MYTRYIKFYDSSNILEIAWDPNTNTMVVTFVSGPRYEYSNITPAILATIVAAKSAGKALQELVTSKQKGKKLEDL